MSAQSKTDDEDLDFEGAETLDAGEDIELVIEDDTPEEDRGRPVAPDTSDDDETDDEMSEYGAKVQARMKYKDRKIHDERRAKEAAIRERDAATAFAAAQSKRSAQLEALLNSASAATVNATKSQAETEIATIKSDLKEAIELGEGDKVADLTVSLQRAVSRLEQAERADAQIKAQPAPQQQQQPQQPQQPTLSARQQAWNSRNKWFGTDKKMTAFALGVHEELVDSGVELESEDYYNRVDRELRKVFPEKFKSSNTPSSAPPVSGVQRRSAAPAGKKVVRLTQSELAVAKRIGVSPQDYAKQKAAMGDSYE